MVSTIISPSEIHPLQAARRLVAWAAYCFAWSLLR